MAKHQRDRAKEVFWRNTFKRQTSSGLSVREFCRRENVTESAFYFWRRTIAERDAELKPPKRPVFLPVVVDGDFRRDGAITIELAGGRVLRLPEATPTQRLVELVHALEARAER